MEGWTEDLPWIGQYILNENGDPVPAPDLLTWGRWMENNAARRVAEDYVGAARVSTVFLGLDHSPLGMFDLPHAPVLWETMVFGGAYDMHQQRYESREEALAGHRKVIQMLTS